MRIRPWQIFKASIAIFWEQRLFFARIAAVPSLTVFAAFFLYVAYLIFDETNPAVAFIALGLVALLGASIVYQLYSFHISWYRYRANLESNAPWIRTDVRRHLKMIWMTCAMVVFASWPLAIVGCLYLVLDSFQHLNFIDILQDLFVPLAVLPAVAWLIIAALRLALVLPAAALDDAMTLKQSFREMQGNGLRVFGLSLLLQLLVVPGRIVDTAISSDAISGSTVLMLGSLNLFFIWVSLAVGVIAYSEVYRVWLVSKLDPQPEAAGVEAVA